MENALWVSMPIIQNIVMGTGCNRAEIDLICQSGRITREQLEDSDLKLSLQQNCAIMETALAISANPTLGLYVGEKTSPVVLGITGHLMQSSKDVLTALENLQQFNQAFTRLYNFYMEIRQDEVYYFCEPLEVWNNISPETARQSVDIAYAGAVHILYLLTGRLFLPKKVMYRYTRVADTGEYVRIFKCLPLFNEPCNSIVFSLTDLRTPIIGHNRELNRIFKNLLEEEIRKENGGVTFTSEVKQMLLRDFQSNFPSWKK